jgi:hypothetical protein
VWGATLALAWPVSSRAGIAFEPEVNLSSSPTPSAVTEVTPQGLAVDPEGRVIAVWSELPDMNTPPELMLRVAGPDGRFGRAVALTPADGKYSGEGALAVTSDGRVAIAWTEQSERFAVEFAYLDLAVGSLQGRAAIPGSANMLVMEPAIVAAPGGVVAVAWTSMADMIFEVKLCRRAADGTWGPIEAVSALDGRASEQPSLACGPDGRLHVVWNDSQSGVRRILYAVHDGKRLSEPKPVDTANPEVRQTRPVVAVSSKGEVVVAWHEIRKDGDRVAVARAEAGKPFDKAVAATRGAGPSRSPAVGVGPGGIVLTWEDERVLTLAEQPSTQIYVGALGAAPGPVVEEQAVTTDRPVSCDHPAMVVDPTGAVHLMWRNSELGQGDICYRKGTLGEGASAAKRAP